MSTHVALNLFNKQDSIFQVIFHLHILYCLQTYNEIDIPHWIEWTSEVCIVKTSHEALSGGVTYFLVPLK